MSPIGTWEIESRALPVFSYPSLPLSPIFASCVSCIHRKLTVLGTKRIAEECPKNTQCIFTLPIWWPVYFLKLGFSWLQHGYNSYCWQLDDIFWVTHMFDSCFMDTFAFNGTNFQIRHNCSNSHATAEDKSTSLCFTATCWTAVLCSQGYLIPMLAKLRLYLALSTML